MANFKTHLKVSSGVSIIVGLLIYTIGVVSEMQAVYLILFGILGGIFPDIDSPHSHSVPWVFNTFGIIIGSIFVFQAMATIGVLLSVLIGFTLYRAISSYVRLLVAKYSIHRGLFHSIPSSILSGLLVVIFTNIFIINPDIPWLMGIFMTTGYLIHLLLDELYSIDLVGCRIKRSFGSAMSLFSRKNIIGYILIYGCIIISIYFLPKYNINQGFDIYKMSQIALSHLMPS